MDGICRQDVFPEENERHSRMLSCFSSVLSPGFLLDYRLTDMEHKWYKVSMGGHAVYVQVDGQGKYLTITGLANPLFCFFRRDLFD